MVYSTHPFYRHLQHDEDAREMQIQASNSRRQTRIIKLNPEHGDGVDDSYSPIEDNAKFFVQLSPPRIFNKSKVGDCLLSVYNYE